MGFGSFDPCSGDLAEGEYSLTRNMLPNQAGGTEAEPGGEGLIIPVQTTCIHISSVHSGKK